MKARATETELQLVQAIASGDQSAFERLFRIYHPRVFKFSMRLLGEPHLAEEATCDTLYAIWQGANKFQGNSAVSTWIFGIAYRRSMKSHHKDARHVNKIEPGVVLEELTEEAPGGNPETYTNNAMEGARMATALQSLSTEQRAVIELMALGHSVAEIAAVVQCPENTVKTRTFHARRKLRDYLQGDHP